MNTTEHINGFTIDLFDIGCNTLLYYDYTGKERKAKLNLATWAKRLHGNVPGGTYFGSYRLILPDGTRYTYRAYL